MIQYTPKFHIGEHVWRRARLHGTLLYAGFHVVIDEVVPQNDGKPWYGISCIRDQSFFHLGMVAEDQLERLS